MFTGSLFTQFFKRTSKSQALGGAARTTHMLIWYDTGGGQYHHLTDSAFDNLPICRNQQTLRQHGAPCTIGSFDGTR